MCSTLEIAPSLNGQLSLSKALSVEDFFAGCDDRSQPKDDTQQCAVVNKLEILLADGSL